MEKPIFIIGNPRSGTSLLRLMLTAHSRIVIAPECGFAIWFLSKYGDWSDRDLTSTRLRSFLNDLFDSNKFETWNLSKQELLEFIGCEKPESYSRLVASVYRFYALSFKPLSKIWGDKNNYYLNYIAELKALFPGARFVHIVRDGRSVACSYKELSEKNLTERYAPRLPSDINAIASEWAGNIERIRRSFDLFSFENVIEVRFEDIVQSPLEKLTSICSFADLEYEPKMLEYYKLGESDGGEPTLYEGWKSKNKSPLLVSEIDRYSRGLTVEERLAFKEVAGEQLKRYGYE